MATIPLRRVAYKYKTSRLHVTYGRKSFICYALSVAFECNAWVYSKVTVLSHQANPFFRVRKTSIASNKIFLFYLLADLSNLDFGLL